MSPSLAVVTAEIQPVKWLSYSSIQLLSSGRQPMPLIATVIGMPTGPLAGDRVTDMSTEKPD